MRPLKLKSSALPFILAKVKRTAAGSPCGDKLVDHRAAGVAVAQEFGHLVESLAGGVVARLAEQAVPESRADFEQVGVAAAHHQARAGNSTGVPARRASRTTA